MATQEQLDQIIALVKDGDFDGASHFFRGEWPDGWLFFAQHLLVQGVDQVLLINTAISESWNLYLRPAGDFGGSMTHLWGTPEFDQSVLFLPVTGLFVPKPGYRWMIANGSATNRLQVDPNGPSTIDGAPSYDIEPGGFVELSTGLGTTPIDAQDETLYESFSGGTGHAVSDVISLSDGTTVTVNAETSGVVTQFTVSSGASTGAKAGDSLGQSSTTGSGTGFVLTLGVGNVSARLIVVTSSAMERTVRLPLATSDAAAGLVSWQNPYGIAVVVEILIDLTTSATGAHTADFGQAATAVLSDTLVDGVDLGTAAGLFSSSDDQGTNGRTFRRIAAGEFVTGSTATGTAAGLVGNVLIRFLRV